MDVSFAVQALVLEHLAGADLAPGVHGVPVAVDAEVARTKLAALGVGLDSLTADAGDVPLELAGLTLRTDVSGLGWQA